MEANSIMGFITFEKLWNDSYLGKISSKYFEFSGRLLLEDKIRTEKLFEYYKKQKFAINEEDAKYFSFSEHDRKYLFPFFASFGEVWHAFEEFEDIIFYIQNYPDTREYRESVTLFQWGNHHLGAVNQQFYILRERVLGFVKTIERIAAKDGDSRLLKLKELQRRILNYFEPLLRKRHELVHEKAYLDDRLDSILARGTRLEKKLHSKKVVWKIRASSDVDNNIKRELGKKAVGVSKELEKLVNFLNSNFVVVWQTIKNW